MDDAQLFEDLSARLRSAHRRVAVLEVEPDEKGRAIRRLLAISDAAKHDLGRASSRLDQFLADLDAGWKPESRD